MTFALGVSFAEPSEGTTGVKPSMQTAIKMPKIIDNAIERRMILLSSSQRNMD
jgi:hypothetical protein